MANAMVLLQSINLVTASSTITFSGIPTNGYKDLRLVLTRVLTAQANMYTRFNGDSGANYSSTGMGFNWQPAPGGFNDMSVTSISDHWGYASTPQGSIAYMDIMDYTSLNKHKTALIRFNGMTTDGQWGMDAMASRWSSTSAITSITFTLSTGQFAAGSTFAIYGIVG